MRVGGQPGVGDRRLGIRRVVELIYVSVLVDVEVDRDTGVVLRASGRRGGAVSRGEICLCGLAPVSGVDADLQAVDAAFPVEIVHHRVEMLQRGRVKQRYPRPSDHIGIHRFAVDGEGRTVVVDVEDVGLGRREVIDVGGSDEDEVAGIDVLGRFEHRRLADLRGGGRYRQSLCPGVG